MGLIREPLEVDFFVDPRPLTEKEKKLLVISLKLTKRKENAKSLKKGTYTQRAVTVIAGFFKYL